jgi:F-type H+-transporting ATPase subunit b
VSGLPAEWSAALSAVPLLPARGAIQAAAEAGEHAAAFLGVPIWIWQLLNLALFLGVLFHFVVRPMVALFRQRQLEVEQKLAEARTRREEAARLEAEIRRRMDRMDAEMAEIRARGAAEGESERAALLQRAEEEVERVRREAEQEIGRRLQSAKDELRRSAADLTASSARQLVAREITEEDRKRLLEESVGKVEQGR